MQVKITIKKICFYLIMVLLLSGCDERESPKKVSLHKREPITVNKVNKPNQEAFKFGFDLRLGPREDVRIYLPFIQYLEQRTGHRFSIRFTEKYEDTVDNLGKGITHFAALGPVNSIIAKKKYKTNCLVMGLNAENKPEYQAVIFTTKNSPINSLKELKDKSFAFGDKYSTQGHIIPRKMLEDEGINLSDLKTIVFTGSHANTARAVLKGEYDAGSIQDVLAKRLHAEGKIKILATSKAYPSSLICHNKDIDPDVIKAVKSALLSFDPKGKHLHLLFDWDKTEMPNGFVDYNEKSLREIKHLVVKYGILR